MKFTYEKATQTLRTVPENYCVASTSSFSEGGFMDAAIENREEVFQLFASAPEMLELLKECHGLLNNPNAEESNANTLNEKLEGFFQGLK